MKNSKMVKNVFTVLSTLCFLFVFTFSASAATKEYGPWKITSSVKNDDFDTVMVYPNYATSLKIKIKQYGVHSGEKADVLWHMWESGTIGGKGWTKRISTDYEGTLTFTGMDPQKIYTVGWMSETNNDMSGQWSVIVDGDVVR